MSIDERNQMKQPTVRTEEAPSEGKGRRGRRAVLKIAIALIVMVFVAALLLRTVSGGKDAAFSNIPTATVQRGELTISVTEGGTLQAMESLEIKSEVEGRHQILEIIPEGTIITQKDVENGKVLARLDASGLDEKRTQDEMTYRNAEASYVQAKESYDIQVNQNESNIKQAELRSKFARMELESYVGKALADELLEGSFDFGSLQSIAKAISANLLDDPELAAQIFGEGYSTRGKSPEETLGGVARQKLRQFSSQVQLAKQELEQAQDKLYWTRQLEEKNYVSRNRLKADELTADRAKVGLDSAKEELRLYIRYTLPKEAEQRLSDYQESKRELERVKARANSELAKARANLESQKANLELKSERFEKTKEMLEKATIRATKPGLVVYASTGNSRRWRSTPIQEGVEVFDNESIIRMPDLATLAARVNIHETDIAKVKVGQKARIRLDAMPDKELEGEVKKVSPMASSENRWLNPDVMVYETDVAITSDPDDLTPGMSATAEIIIAELADVLYVPVQAVTSVKGHRICWVKTADGPELRELETGYCTDKFVEIKSGLHEGEPVYLAPPTELLEEARGQLTESQPPKDKQQTPPAAKAGEAPTKQEKKEPEQQIDLDKLRKEMEGMSREERMKYFQDLSPEKRQKLMEMGPKSVEGGQAGAGGKPGSAGPGAGGRPGGRPGPGRGRP